MSGGQTVRVAAVQDTPVLLNRDATLDRVDELTDRAAADGAQLVVFPEAFVPGPPVWIDALAVGDEARVARPADARKRGRARWPPFRAEVKDPINRANYSPAEGSVVAVEFDPKSHDVRFACEDPCAAATVLPMT